ncbi:DNA-processing protein DprA [Streptomyces sp. HNM0663]|uniref:DNA-processing protein DprA n=1 Tax=Streptomyces chengmaiensis TaxID=3040919 RepID=A0ABT6HSQ2_9ACTN|nr:DNA-processing protein DprA [Streptomyces chengmaiensis]MDH2391352.1 DNA-processing protein DprA [Streptomyces chengmaiensis]
MSGGAAPPPEPDSATATGTDTDAGTGTDADADAGRRATAAAGSRGFGRGRRDPRAAVEDERTARAALTRVIEPGDDRGGRWLREFGAQGLLERLTGPPDEPDALPGATPRGLAGYRTRAASADPERDLAAVAAVGGRFIVPGDPEWPTQLDDLGDARPIGLWACGRPDLRKWALRSVAVVGARACTPYGAHLAAALGSGLAERGWVVVSGAAFGIDGAAHRGALAADGATVAVLACGVDVVYPRGHAQLIRRVAEQGLVVGELPPGDHPTPSRFILRNRVIAALTRGTVVVEAEYRSGSLVTARAAHRLGRHTMGVPGPVTSGLSAGVHELLRGEATLVTDAAEVVELVGEMGDLAPERRGPVLPRDLLDPLSGRLLEAFPARGTADSGGLARAVGLTPDETGCRLYELHSLGFVERVGDRWQLTRCASQGPNVRRGGA